LDKGQKGRGKNELQSDRTEEGGGKSRTSSIKNKDQKGRKRKKGWSEEKTYGSFKQRKIGGGKGEQGKKLCPLSENLGEGEGWSGVQGHLRRPPGAGNIEG